MNKKTVITIKASWRLEYLKETLDALYQCRNIDNYNVILSVDYSDNQRNIMNMVNKYHNKRNLTVVYSPIVLGCAGNMRKCFELAFDDTSYEYMLHLEDDTKPSVDYLEYMEKMLPLLENDDIFTICPYRRKSVLLTSKDNAQNHMNKYTKDKWFECAGGFAINRKEYEVIKSEDGIYGVSGNKITDRGSWALPFAVRYIKNRYCIFPIVNRVINFGEEGLHLSKNNSLFKRTIYVAWSSSDFNNKIDKFEEIDISNYKDKK